MPERWFLARANNLANLKSALDDPRLEWVYAERMEDTVLCRLKDLLHGPADLACWEHGRAFGPALEVAWWQQSGGMDLRACAEQGDPPAGPAWQADPLGPELRKEGVEMIRLFGEHDASQASPDGQPAWSQASIPRYLYYPVSGQPQRVALEVALYQVDGLRREQRLMRVTGVQENGNG